MYFKFAEDVSIVFTLPGYIFIINKNCRLARSSYIYIDFIKLSV